MTLRISLMIKDIQTFDNHEKVFTFSDNRVFKYAQNLIEQKLHE